MRQTFLNKKNLLKILIILSLVGITILAFVLSNLYAKNYKNNDKEETKEVDDFTKNEDNEIVNDSNTKSDDKQDESIADGLVLVYMQLIDKEGNIIFDEAKREKNQDNLYDILVKYHDVRAENSTYGMIIFDIDSVKTKFYSESYISILVNGKYSSFGISNIYVYDGIRITFKEVALGQ